MKRIIAVLAVVAAIALASASMALATRHATKSQRVAAVGPEGSPAGAVCTDPSKCPPGACKLDASSASAAATQKGAECTNPSACPASCPVGKTATTATVASK
jgi:hypothetical protein